MLEMSSKGILGSFVCCLPPLDLSLVIVPRGLHVCSSPLFVAPRRVARRYCDALSYSNLILLGALCSWTLCGSM